MALHWAEIRDELPSVVRDRLDAARKTRIQSQIDSGSYHGALLATPFTRRQTIEVSRQTMIDLAGDRLVDFGQPGFDDGERARLMALEATVAAELCVTVSLEQTPIDRDELRKLIFALPTAGTENKSD